MQNITGSNIKKYREKRKITQKEMVERLQEYGLTNITQGAISLIESQARKVNDIELQAFSDILNISVKKLMQEEKQEINKEVN